MNSTVSTARVRTFLCPSQPEPSFNLQRANGLTTIRAPGNSYYASYGSSLEYDRTQQGGPPNGPFAYLGTSIGLRDITDGSSNTVGFGEWQIGTGNQSVYTIPSDLCWLGQYPPGVTRNTPQMVMPAGAGPFRQWVALCATQLRTTTRNPNSVVTGQAWAFNLMGHSLGNLVLAPNPKYPNCIVNSGTTQLNPAMWNPSSFHPGGANMLFCDGSVRFLKDSTNLNTVWALGSISQGEVVSADAY